MLRISKLTAFSLALALAGAIPHPGYAQEVEILPADRQMLDPFESISLRKADKSFAEKQYKTAAAEYDSFILEFPQSRCLAYILLRTARSTHLDDKRYEAIKKYRQVLDYYPDASHYAAAALYYIGACHSQNGDPENAIKAWTQMVQDKRYNSHFLAASALNQLAENHLRLGNPDEAMRFYEQVVTDFRTANRNAAIAAMSKVIEYRMKTKPDEPALARFYIKVKGFKPDPAKDIPEDVSSDRTYWDFIRNTVKEFGRQFTVAQATPKIKFYRYWADAMEGKFADWDDFQIDLADMKQVFENDADRRARRLDEQFNKYQKQDDFARIIKWMGIYAGQPDKIMQYYSKLDMAKLSEGTKRQLLATLLNTEQFDMAANLLGKLNYSEMNDQAKLSLFNEVKWFVRKGFPTSEVVRLSERVADADKGRMALLRFYHEYRNPAPGIPLAEKMEGVPAYANEAAEIDGDMLYWSGQHEKAVAKYQLANRPPSTIFKISDCYVRMKKIDNAVAALREIEGFFVKDASRAAYRISQIYRETGDKKRYVAALLHVMNKHPGSGESSAAHEELENMGVNMKGGVDAE